MVVYNDKTVLWNAVVCQTEQWPVFGSRVVYGGVRRHQSPLLPSSSSPLSPALLTESNRSFERERGGEEEEEAE